MFLTAVSIIHCMYSCQYICTPAVWWKCDVSSGFLCSSKWLQQFSAWYCWHCQ